MSDGGRREPGYGDDYADENDDYYTYDATDEEDEGRRRPFVILAVLVLLVVFAGVVFFAYKQGLRQGAQGNPPIIRSDSSPIKVAPVDPGGMQIPHRDRSIYDRISGTDDSASQDTEHLLPRAEEPLSMETQGQSPVAPSGVPEAAQNSVTVPAAPSSEVEEPSQTKAPAAVPSRPAPAATVPSTAPATSAGGGYVVQLAAFRDEASAREAFDKLRAKYSVLAKLSADIQRVDLGVKGIYYRLRAGYLPKSGAEDLCASLAAKSQPCLVRAK
jgi:cell division septation protein DedD